MSTKICNKCNEEKALSCFEFRYEVNRHRHACKKCRNTRKKVLRYDDPSKSRLAYIRYKIKNPEKEKERLRRNYLWTAYRLTLEDYASMHEDHEGKCACCGTHQSELPARLFVDHDHTTGEVRGLLCNGCNTALGMVKDNVNTLNNMIKYLDRHNSKDEDTHLPGKHKLALVCGKT